MISLFRWLSAFAFRRFRWVAVGALLRSLTRRTRERSVEAATDELAERLPPSVVRAAEAAPGDLLRQGGRVLATGRNARHLGSASRQVGSASKRLGDVGRRVRRHHWQSAVESVRSDWSDETDMIERETWAEYHRSLGDHEAADDALLDHRRAEADQPLPEVPPAVAPGRPRSMARRRQVVRRVQRSYEQARKPWD